MSVVTDIIITCSVMEEQDGGFPAIDHLQSYLLEHEKGRLAHLNGHEGGYKAWQVEVFGGAFNYLDLEEFGERIKTAPWIEAENVVVLAQEEHEERMQILDRPTESQPSTNDEGLPN